MIRLLRSFIACALVATALVAQTAVSDRFDRANGTNLGPDWTEVNANAVIENNRLKGASPFELGFSAHTVFAANYASTVIRTLWSMNGGGGDRISVIAGLNPATWSGIEVRVADNDGDGLADRIFMNQAVNAGNWYGSSLFFNIAAPLASGEVTLSFANSGDTAVVTIRNTATLATETFYANGILTAPPTGTAVGVGYFGDGFADDFRAWTGTPDTLVFTTNPPRVGSSFTLLVTDGPPSGTVLIGYSLAGNAPIPTVLGNVYLTEPIELLGPLPLDLNGSWSAVLPPFGSGTLGITLHTQALELTVPVLSNAFSLTVL